MILAATAVACSSGGGTSPTTPSVPSVSATATGPGTVVTITMVDFKFKPANVTANTSQAIVLVNEGSVIHNFSIAGTSVDVDVRPGETVTLPPPGTSFPAGTFSFFCKYHKANGMTGTLHATH